MGEFFYALVVKSLSRKEEASERFLLGSSKLGALFLIIVAPRHFENGRAVAGFLEGSRTVIYKASNFPELFVADPYSMNLGNTQRMVWVLIAGFFRRS